MIDLEKLGTLLSEYWTDVRSEAAGYIKSEGASAKRINAYAVKLSKISKVLELIGDDMNPPEDEDE